MRDEIVSEETARLAKQKGFNETTDYLFGEYDGYCGLHIFENDNRHNNDKQFSAPTQKCLQKWLREVHNFQVYAYSNTIHRKDNVSKFVDYVVYVNTVPLNDAWDEEFQTYEEALEIGLQHALEEITQL